MADEYTLVIRDGDVVLIRGERPSPTAAGFFLMFLLMAGLCLNALLVLGLSVWPPQRGATVARLLLLQLCSACLLDCTLDVTSSAAVLLLLYLGVPAGSEGKAETFCRVNAMFSLYIAIVEGVIVAALAVERAVALRGLQCNGKLTEKSRTWLLLLVVWGYPAVLVLPMGVTSGVTMVRPFADRLCCGMVLRSSDKMLYPGLLTVLGGVLPWSVAIVAVASMACHVARVHRRRQRLEEAAMQRGSQRAVPAVGQMPWEDSRFHLLAVVVATQFLLMVAPNAGSASLPPYLKASSAKYRDVFGPVSTGNHDAVFLWTRYLFPSTTAAVALVLVKEARKKCEAIFCQRAGSNAVAQLDEALSVKPTARYARAAHYRTPVLFATSEGLHLRIVRDARGQLPATTEPGFACEFCDLAILTASTPPSKKDPRESQRRSAAPLFGPEPVAEGDLKISDSLTSAEVSPPTATHRQLWADDCARISDSAEERRARHAHRKVVRFAQTVSEIPMTLAESADWGPHDEFGADRYKQPARFESRLS